MATPSPLLVVPIDVKALVVNDEVRYGQDFQRWRLNYRNLDSYTSPEPPAFSGNADDFGQFRANNGVYLHWELPAALRHATQQDGVLTHPPVPNRWLVVRYSGAAEKRQAVAWVVESDFVHPSQGTVPYLIPHPDEQAAQPYQVTNLGRKLRLKDWQPQEPDATYLATAGLHLTAVAPGNLTFAAYQPYVENVFSFHDDFADGHDGSAGVGDTDTLSYQVIGWYSEDVDDILQNATLKKLGLEAALKKLGWQAPSPPSPTTRSVYDGRVIGLKWEKSGPIPDSDRPADSATVKVAVGHTAIDALTAFIRYQLTTLATDEPSATTSLAAAEADLLEAFQYDLVRVLDQPDGQARLQELIHQAWFSAAPGGYQWEVVANPANPDGTLLPLADELADQLVKMNNDQNDTDKKRQILTGLQWQLYAAWWKLRRAAYLNGLSTKSEKQYGPSEQITRSLQAKIDGPGQLKDRIKSLQQHLASSDLPTGPDQQTLDKSIKDYANAHQFPQTRVLKQSARPSFFQAQDPVVMLTGTKVNDLLTDEDKLPCRWSDQLVTSVTQKGVTYTTELPRVTVPTFGLPKDDDLQAAVNNLLREFPLLDTANTGIDLSRPEPKNQDGKAPNGDGLPTVVGPLPALGLTAWGQPWAPLFLMWEAEYFPIPYEQWQFTGTDYTWDGQGAAREPIVLSGRIFLTPQSSFNFKKRLKQWSKDHPAPSSDSGDTGTPADPAAELNTLGNFIDQTDHWDFLSQTLNGFSQQLLLRDPLPNRLPDPNDELAALIGGQHGYVPRPGDPSGTMASEFQPIRAGQFYFNRLVVVDRFGQSIEVANTITEKYLTPVKAPDLEPDEAHFVVQDETRRLIQLKPRLLQPARLNFDFVSPAHDDQLIDLAADANPVCGWVMLNYLDDALACYDPAGSALGELRVAVDAVVWRPAPTSGYDKLEKLTADYPHLGSMLLGLQTAGTAAFEAFRKMIDESLWSTAPTYADRGLSLLTGRPLALTRARLQYQLMGEAITDPSWPFTPEPPTPALTACSFPIALGREGLTQDGLIGYFKDPPNGQTQNKLDETYRQFNCVHRPASVASDPDAYLQQVGEGSAGKKNYMRLRFNDSDAQYLTLLADPWLAVQATTVVLPVIKLSLPDRFVSPALNRIEAQFWVGPLLTDRRQDADSTGPAIFLPQPSEKHGTWSWLQRLEGKDKWDRLGVQPTDERARFPTEPPCLREGVLTLSPPDPPTSTQPLAAAQS